MRAENLYGVSEPSTASNPATIVGEKPIKARQAGQQNADRRQRGFYDGPRIDNYDKFYHDLWKGKEKPQPTEIRTGSVYDYYEILEELGRCVAAFEIRIISCHVSFGEIGAIDLLCQNKDFSVTLLLKLSTVTR